MSDELVRLTAVEAVDRLLRGEVSPTELVEASIARTESVDGTLNAMPTHCFERAREHARRIERKKRPSRPSPQPTSSK